MCVCMYTNKKRIEMYIFINIYTYYINRKYHIRNTSYSLCSFRPMLKSVIFLSVSTILVCFSVHGNAGWLLQWWRPSRNRGRKKKRSYKKENNKKRDQRRWKRTNIVDFILGLKDIGNAIQKWTKRIKKNMKESICKKKDDTKIINSVMS